MTAPGNGRAPGQLNPYVRDLQCVVCGRSWPATLTAGTCPACGPQGILEVRFDYKALGRDWDRDRLGAQDGRGAGTGAGMWQFWPFLPVGPQASDSPLIPGGTPLVDAPRLARAVGVGRLWLKDEGRNPTASLKDRASAVGVAMAKLAGARVVATASTGNAASSLAGAAAASGLRSVIFVPRTAAEAKIAQLLIFGAVVLVVEGSYADAFRLARQAIEEYGWYSRLSGLNPYLVEGKKTAGLELARDLGWRAPDWVVVSVGDGCTVAGVAKAFEELAELGWMEGRPRVLGVQAQGAPAVAEFFRTGSFRPGPEATIADGIAVGEPRNYLKAARRVRASGGTFVEVSDDEIREAMRLTGRLAGVFAEPAAAAAVAGLARAAREGIVGRGDEVAVLITGSGLKDVRRAVEAGGSPIRVAADPQAVRAALPAEVRE